MSIDYEPDRRHYRVRCREHGSRRSRRFLTRSDAEAFAASLQPAPEPPPAPPPRNRTAAVSMPTPPRRGHAGGCCIANPTAGSPPAAASKAERPPSPLAPRPSRGAVRPAQSGLAGDLRRMLVQAAGPYVTAGTLQDYATHGRKRLLPWFGELPIAAIDEDRVRDFWRRCSNSSPATLSPQTVNNARTCLSMTLGEAVRRGQLVHDACRHVPGLPEERRELDYLRLDEIERYLETCGDFYRPLAEFLIGTGARISEALAVRWPDADLETGILRISRQRARTTPATEATKGKRFRSVLIGPRLVATLQQLRDERATTRRHDDGWVFLCPPPLRGRYSRRTEPVPKREETPAWPRGWRLARVTPADDVPDKPPVARGETSGASGWPDVNCSARSLWALNFPPDGV